jgi:hypothetical protein
MVLKEATAKEAGRIIYDEQDEIIKVSWASYARYIDFAGGWGIVFLLNFICVCFITVQFFCNYYTQ